MKKISGYMVVGIFLSSMFGCSPDSEADIVNDIEVQQHSDKPYYRVANNTDQNHTKVKRSLTLETYAENAGYYLSNTINRLEELAPYLEGHFGEQEQRATRQIIIEIKENSAQLMEQDRPNEFNEFHAILLSMLTELDALDRVLADIREPSHPSQIQNAQVYYENTVISHKQLETEYQSLAEELGFY